MNAPVDVTMGAFRRNVTPAGPAVPSHAAHEASHTHFLQNPGGKGVGPHVFAEEFHAVTQLECGGGWTRTRIPLMPTPARLPDVPVRDSARDQLHTYSHSRGQRPRVTLPRGAGVTQVRSECAASRPTQSGLCGQAVT